MKNALFGILLIGCLVLVSMASGCKDGGGNKDKPPPPTGPAPK